MQYSNVKQLKRSILVGVMLVAVSSVGVDKVTLSPLEDCQETLQLCDAYATSLREENEQLHTMLEHKNQRITELEGLSEGMPWYWYVGFGVAAGVLGSGVVK